MRGVFLKTGRIVKLISGVYQVDVEGERFDANHVVYSEKEVLSLWWAIS